MNTDQLVDGPFGSNACYEQVITDGNTNTTITTWMCFGSGFTTSTLMTEGSNLVKQAIETSPELYKDLMHKDEKGLVWLPATITIPEKGMVFVDGTDKKMSKEQTHKMDMQNVKHFNQNDFMDAAEYIGMFEVDIQ